MLSTAPVNNLQQVALNISNILLTLTSRQLLQHKVTGNNCYCGCKQKKSFLKMVLYLKLQKMFLLLINV